MSEKIFAGLTEQEWAEREWAERYDPHGGYRGLVLTIPVSFIEERLVPLGDAATVVGTAVWYLAMKGEGDALSYHDIRLLACRLGTWETIDYEAALELLEKQGLIQVSGDEVTPLFYPTEKARFDSWRQQPDRVRALDYAMGTSWAVPRIEQFRRSLETWSSEAVESDGSRPGAEVSLRLLVGGQVSGTSRER